MARTPRPIDTDRVTENVLKMIDAHRDKPCPTRREIIQWTGLCRREVWPFLRTMQERGLIEIQEIICARAGMRRLRVFGGPWTGWTARRKAWREKARLLELMRA